MAQVSGPGLELAEMEAWIEEGCSRDLEELDEKARGGVNSSKHDGGGRTGVWSG